jgi:hypothetical protein
MPGGSGDTSAELYSPGTGMFNWAGDMTTRRLGHTATLLPDGTVLIAGGRHIWPPGSGKDVDTSSAEIYRPPVLLARPALLSVSGDGRGQGAILRAGTGQVASSSNPAAVGESLEIYLTGLADRGVIPPQVTIGGRTAQVLWFGRAPGFAGLDQVNVRVPGGVGPGPAVPVRLNYLDRPSNEVTIAVQ